MIKIPTSYAVTMILWCLLPEQWNIYKHIKTLWNEHNLQRYMFSAYMTHKTSHFTELFQTATFEMQRYLFSRTWRHFPRIMFPYFYKKIIFVTESIFYKFYYFPQFSFSDHNLFLLSILQHVIASKCNYINTMLPNEMVLALLQKLEIKYELSYQSTTRLKYIDKFDQLLIIHQWSSSVDNTVWSLTHFTIFIWYYVVKHFQFFMTNIIIK